MIHSKRIKIDYNDFPKPLIISSNPMVDFLATITKVTVVYQNAQSIDELLEEFTSSKQIFEFNQRFNSSFQIPVRRNGKIEIEILIQSPNDGVEDFIIT